MEPLKLKKGNLILYIILLAAAVATMVVSYPRQSHTPKAVSSSDTLDVAIKISPIGVTSSADTLSGFYYDMIKRIAETNNLNIRISGFTVLSSALESLAHGNYDLVIADIPVTQELRNRFIFTDPIYADREVLVQLKDSVTELPPITSQSQLRGDTVHLSARSPFLTRIRNLSREIGDTIYVVQNADYGPEQLMILVAHGKIKNVVINEQVAKAIATDYPQLDLSLSLSFNQFQSWALAPKDSILCDSLNIFIERFKRTKEFPKLLDRYFNERPALSN